MLYTYCSADLLILAYLDGYHINDCILNNRITIYLLQKCKLTLLGPKAKYVTGSPNPPPNVPFVMLMQTYMTGAYGPFQAPGSGFNCYLIINYRYVPNYWIGAHLGQRCLFHLDRNVQECPPAVILGFDSFMLS